MFRQVQLSVHLSHPCSHLSSNFIRKPWAHSSHSSASPTKDESKYKAINKVKDVVCFLLSCRKYFCKYVESIKYLLDSASFDDSDKTIMYRGICVDNMWLCNLCTFATRPIKVLFSYFKISPSCVCLPYTCLHRPLPRFVFFFNEM